MRAIRHISTSGAPHSWPAGKVVDDNPISWWVSKKGAPEPQWLEIDLESLHRISGIKLYFGENHPQKFVVSLARDMGAWHPAAYALETEEIDGGDVRRIHRLELSSPEDDHYVRLELRDAAPHPDYFVVTEFAVFGRKLWTEEKVSVP